MAVRVCIPFPHHLTRPHPPNLLSPQTEQQIDALIDRARRPLLDPNDEAHINEYVDQELQGLNMHDA